MTGTTIVAGYDVAVDLSPFTEAEVVGMAHRARVIAQEVQAKRPDLSVAAARYADELDQLAEDPEDVDALHRAEAALDTCLRLQRPTPGMLEVRTAGGVEPSNAELLAQIKALQAQVARLEAAQAKEAGPAVEHRPALARETRRMHLEPSERERRRLSAGELNAPRERPRRLSGVRLSGSPWSLWIIRPPAAARGTCARHAGWTALPWPCSTPGAATSKNPRSPPLESGCVPRGLWASCMGGTSAPREIRERGVTLARTGTIRPCRRHERITCHRDPPRRCRPACRPGWSRGQARRPLGQLGHKLRR